MEARRTVRADDIPSVPFLSFSPRLLRPHLAAAYLGMNKNNFNRLVRPSVRAIPLGKRAIAFDRLELDAWTEEYCRRNGRPAREEGRLCRDEKCQGSADKSVPTAASSWKLDKRIRQYGRICESTGTSDYDEAERYLTRRLEEIRAATVYGVRPKRTFRDAATKYLKDHTRRRGISRDATALKNLDPYIGDRFIDEIHDGTFDKFRKDREAEGVSVGSVDRDVGTAARVRLISAEG